MGRKQIEPSVQTLLNSLFTSIRDNGYWAAGLGNNKNNLIPRAGTGKPITNYYSL